MRPPETIADADLARLSSFRLPGRARQLVLLDAVDQLQRLPETDSPRLILGSGSNTLFFADWPGQILLNRLSGITAEALDDHQVRVRAAAGESWHGLVRWCLDRGLHGIENLVLIPGSVGAAPMQNIGAYGLELGEVLESVEAWDFVTGQQVQIPAKDCALSYRDSRFKSADQGRFLITAVNLILSRQFRPRLHYQSLAQQLARHRLDQPSARQLTAAVMRLRRHRLPDPARLPNAGSFFKNPIVKREVAATLLDAHPELPSWPVDADATKLSAAWMIEHLGWKGRRIGDAGVYPGHALVLINHGSAQAADVAALVHNIRSSVKTAFGLLLEPEPRLIGWHDQGSPDRAG